MDLKALYKVSYGLYIVSSKRGDRLNGQIVNTVFQITAEPPTLAVSINRQNLTHEFLVTGTFYTISILRQETPMKFIGTFGFKSGRDINKFDGVNYRLGVTGQPIVLDNAVGYFELEKIGQMELGSHTIFVGKIVDAQCLSDEPPLTYAYYHDVKKGYASKAAPTYIDPKQLKT